MLTEQMFFEKRIKYVLLDRKTTDFFDEKPPHNPSDMRGIVFPIIPYQLYPKTTAITVYLFKEYKLKI